jgi:hypothetical protein
MTSSRNPSAKKTKSVGGLSRDRRGHRRYGGEDDLQRTSGERGSDARTAPAGERAPGGAMELVERQQRDGERDRPRAVQDDVAQHQREVEHLAVALDRVNELCGDRGGEEQAGGDGREPGPAGELGRSSVHGGLRGRG